MKYFLRICIVLLIALGVVFGYSYYYREKKNNETIVLTTHAISTTQKGEITTKDSKNVVYNDNGFELFTDGDKGYIVYNDVQKELDSFGWVLKQKPLDIYFGDYDGDNENELLLMYTSASSELNNALLPQDKDDFSSTHLYAALVKPVTDSEGKQDFKVVYADQKTWKKPFELAINAQMNQLKSCDKFVQFVMDDNDVDLSYNDKTGISDNKYVYYALAVKNSNSNGYQKFIKWGKGNGCYYLGEDGTLQLDIMVLAYYDEEPSKAQYVGNIHTGISVNSQGKLSITPGTIEFIPNEKYVAADPRKSASEKFTYIINNSSSDTFNTNDNYIDWLEASIDVSPNINEQTLSFANLDSQIKCVDKVKVTQSSMSFFAKPGFVFSDRVLKNGDFSVVINSGTDDEYDIVYKAEIKEKDGISLIKLTFDRKYTRDELKNIVVKFGV